MSGHEMSANTTIMIIPANSEIIASEVLNQFEDETDYTSPPAGLTPVMKCCLKRKCFNKFAPQVQEDCFNRSDYKWDHFQSWVSINLFGFRFWSIKSKTNQNYFLAGLMSADEPKRTVQNPVRHNKTVSWTYFVDVRGKKVQVCQNFLTGVYGISSSKIQTIQNKLVSGSSLDDLRGRYSKKKKREDIDEQTEDVSFETVAKRSKKRKTK